MARTAKKGKADKTLHFEPTAYIQRLFGRDLISSDTVAVAELVKNAYDAGAHEVIVTLNKDEPQKITISDNGRGMSLAEFRRVWMRPGYSEKTIKDKKTKRPYLGEKGIGRFAADKLANKLTVITKKVSESDALLVNFDWSEFDNRKKNLQDIAINYLQKRDAELTLGHSGTRLELNELRKEWNLGHWNRLRQELQRLIVPSGKVFKFKIVASVEGVDTKGWDSGEIKSKFKAEDEYEYVFTLSKAGNLTWSLSRPKRITKEIKTKSVESGVSKAENIFGFVAGRFYYVEASRTILKHGYKAGVGIYRDGFRVAPYGEEDNDWLKVKSTKASKQGHAPINPSQLFGFVEISRQNNPKLNDVTNREGIQESEEFEAFQKFIKGQFDHFAGIIENDNDRLPLSPTIQAQQQQKKRQTRAQAFAQMASQLAHQLRQPLNHIRMSSTNLTDRLEIAGTPDPVINGLTEMIQRNILRMNENITSLSKVAQGLRDQIVEFDLVDFVNNLVSTHQANFEQEGVRLELDIIGNNKKAKYGRVALEFILENFLTNAFRAASETDDPSGGKVTIKVEEILDGKHKIVVMDNGRGIPDTHVKKLFNEIIPNAEGDGTGLVWSRIWAEEYGGGVGFEDQSTGAAFYLEF